MLASQRTRRAGGALLALLVLQELWRYVDQPEVRHRFPHRAGIHLGAEAALLVVASILPLIGAARDAIRLATRDSLDTAREWIEADVAPGSHIGGEFNAPWVDPQRFSVQSFHKLNDQPPEWYINEGYRYLVFSETMFRRFYKDPARLSDAIARYEAIFRACVETKAFTDKGYEVQVCLLP